MRELGMHALEPDLVYRATALYHAILCSLSPSPFVCFIAVLATHMDASPCFSLVVRLSLLLSPLPPQLL